MSKFFYVYLATLLTYIFCQVSEILPFSSITMHNDDIFITLDLKRSEWTKLLSINNIGSDALVNFSKQHYGLLKCDYEIECYKYNILKNFNEVYQLFSHREIGPTVSIELE